MYVNAGIASLFYPVTAFGYGMLEEKRPGKSYWRLIQSYTIYLLFAKIICSQQVIKNYVFKKDFYLENI